MRRFLTARSQITIGLVALLVSVLCAAKLIGLVPDRNAAIADGRGHLCEQLAIGGSDYIGRGELKRLEFLLQSTVERNEHLLSAAVRRADGTLTAMAGNHAEFWQDRPGARSSETNVHVPIRSGKEKWGSLELCFRPVSKPGIYGFLQGPWLLLVGFVAAVSYLLFLIYLGKMLEHLDPSKTVPRRVRAALDSLAEGLLVIDREGRVVLANQAFAGWVGRSPDKVIGRKASSLGWVHETRDGLVEPYPWVEAIRQEQPQAGYALTLQRKNEPTRMLIANASPVLGHDGEYRGVLVSFDDVTQLEEAKKGLSEAKEAAEGANRAKSEFLAHMSHEIRTPMNAILGYTDVLRRGFDENTEDRKEYLDTIHSSGEHLLALINNILDLSKVESGRMVLDLAPCSPHQICHQVVSVLRVKAEEKGLSLHVESHGRLPETILTDSVRLRQAIMNLVGNAIKFTETGGVTIAPRLIHGPSKSQLAVDIIDTGIGIPEEAQQRIFDPFAQADASTTRHFGGTGLGLAISRRLAEALGGTLTVRSDPGKGSVFTLAIETGSLDGIRFVDAATARADTKQQAQAEPDQVRLPTARILVADDGKSNRDLVRLVLGRAGATIETAENGQQAVDLMKEESFDAVLMDMQMPAMDGYTAATILRQQGFTVPIIALTAHAMQGDEEKCLQAGCSGFLAKPISIDRLLSTVAEALTAREDSSHAASDLQQKVCPSAGTSALPAPRVDEAETARETPLAAPSDRKAEPLISSLPMDDPDFREIVEEFVERLEQKLCAMDAAWKDRDLAELASLAHWLKGSGGTAGFDVFTLPSKELEQLAKQEGLDAISDALAELHRIAQRIIIPATEALQ